MAELLNTLYVQKQSVILQLSHDTVQAKLEGETLLRLPLVRSWLAISAVTRHTTERFSTGEGEMC